jgi:hypothetical protein
MGFVMATVNGMTTVDDVFEYQPPRIVFEEASGDVTASIPDECVEFMDGVRRSMREQGNPNPVFGFNERGALFRMADGDDADWFLLTGEYRDNGDGSVDVSKYVVAVNGKTVYETGYEVDGENISRAWGEAMDAFMATLGIPKVK